MNAENLDRNIFRAFLPGPRVRLEPLRAGPLSGLSLAVKDLFDIKGFITGGGNPDWSATGRPAFETARAVRMLLEAGATCVGKTVTDELAFSLEGRNAHYGVPINPRDRAALAGGSSSGSAVAVASGEADIGLGSDTGGSVRVPGAFCGIWAMRPSHGRVPVEGLQPFAPSYDTVGWFARTGELLAAVGAELLGPEETDVPLSRYLVASDACALADGDVCEEVEQAALDVNARPVEAFPVAWQDISAAYTALQARDIRAALGPELASRRPMFGADIAPRFQGALKSDEQIAHHEVIREAARLHLDRLLPPGSVLILPTAPVRRLARDADGVVLCDFYKRALALCAIAGHAGAPQIHVPLGEAGFSIAGRVGSDRALLDLACTWSAK